jgi:hypothetical protein
MIVTAFQGMAFADEYKFVTVVVGSIEKTLSVDPVKAKRGDAIIWVNQAPGPITIKFITKLGIACRAPANFYADLFGYYETGQIPQAGTASICFIEKGEYKYEVKRLVGKDDPREEISQGSVIVE